MLPAIALPDCAMKTRPKPSHLALWLTFAGVTVTAFFESPWIGTLLEIWAR